MKKKLTAILLAAVLAVGMMTGCSSTGSTEDVAVEAVEDAEENETGEDETEDISEETVDSLKEVSAGAETSDSEKEETAETAEVEEAAEAAETAETEAESEETDPGYTVTSIDKTMYARSTVNVRSLPSTDGEKQYALSPGEEVHVTGQASTGWYQLEDGNFVSNSYLSETYPFTSEYTASSAESTSASSTESSENAESVSIDTASNDTGSSAVEASNDTSGSGSDSASSVSTSGSSTETVSGDTGSSNNDNSSDTSSNTAVVSCSHNYVFDRYDSSFPPTCTNSGYGVYVCTICGDTTVMRVDALGHDYVRTVAKEATCISPAYVDYYCSRCNKCENSGWEGDVDPDNHAYDVGEEDGMKFCTGCGKIFD